MMDRGSTLCAWCGGDYIHDGILYPHEKFCPEKSKSLKQSTSIHSIPEEVRVTDQVTGGQKGKKLTEIGFVDPLALMELGKVAGKGSQKYDKFNYLKGYDWSLSYNAAQRHAMQAWSGEDVDEETQCLHFAMAAWHFLALTSFMLRKLGQDDRPKL